jgi:hypothetical protein
MTHQGIKGVDCEAISFGEGKIPGSSGPPACCLDLAPCEDHGEGPALCREHAGTSKLNSLGVNGGTPGLGEYIFQ